MLKMMEKFVDSHIRDEILRLHPLHQYQFTYQTGRPLQLHCTMWLHIYRKQWKTGKLHLQLSYILRELLIATHSTSQQRLPNSLDTICSWLGSILGGLGLSAVRHFTVSTSESGCGRTPTRTQWEWLLHCVVSRWNCYPHQQKIPKHRLRASGYEYGTIVVRQNSVVYQSTKDGDSTIHQEKRFKGPTGTNPLWRQTAADYWGKIPLTSFWTRDWLGRHSWKTWWITLTGLFGPVSAHLVKPGGWNQGLCPGSTPWWSDPY